LLGHCKDIKTDSDILDSHSTEIACKIMCDSSQQLDTVIFSLKFVFADQCKLIEKKYT